MTDGHRETPGQQTSLREIVDASLLRWEELTGVARNATGFTLGTLGLKGMNMVLDEMLETDPGGTTSYLLLECFLRAHLESKTFTAAQIMKDYAATTAYLEKAEELFSIVQSERAVEIIAHFRGRVRAGLERYGADTAEALEVINDPDALPFLRRDALRAIDRLKPFQFLSGDPDAAAPGVFEHIYIAWSLDDLLHAVRDMPISGIAVVLMRDAAHPNRSYFTFAMRNGGNVILLTDKDRPAYPGQEDRLASRSRGRARDYAERADAYHFPYQLVPTHTDEKGDTVFDPETAPVAAGPRLAPLMRIGALPPNQSIWITMMLSLIHERFWSQGWQAPALSYTGAMIREPRALVTGGDGAQLPVAEGYREITLPDLTVDDVTASAMAEQCAYAPQGINDWLEARYRHLVGPEILNARAMPGRELFLPSPLRSDTNPFRKEVPEPVAGEIMSIEVPRRPMSGDRPPGYSLAGMTDSEFGTQEELNRDRIFLARQNMAAAIQRAADTEYAARKDAILAWYQARVRANLAVLMDMVDDGVTAWERHDPCPGGYRRHRVMTITDLTSAEDRRYSPMPAKVSLGDYVGGRKRYACYLTDAKASWRVRFTPETTADLALLAGCTTEELPDVLQNWDRVKRHDGNHLLNRMDPMDTDLKDPWTGFPADVELYLSKRAMTAARTPRAT